MGEYVFKMPDIGEGVVEAEITAWHVQVGDTVKEDAPVADAMTDKATVELTAPVSGVVKSIGCEAGEILAIGANLVVFTTDGADGVEVIVEPDPAPEPYAAPIPAPVEKPTSAPQTITPPATPSAQTGHAKVLAAPAVRRRASQMGIDLAAITPSDPSGRITHADLDRALRERTPETKPTSETPAPTQMEPEPLQEGERRVKIIGLRRVIAERMEESKRNLAHFTYVDDIDVTDLEALRKRTNARLNEGETRLTVLPFIIAALTKALKQWPQMNAHYRDDEGYLAEFSHVHLGIATQTDLGLVVPVLRYADERSLSEIAAEIARLAAAARSNTLSKDELIGATTTLTSLGPLGGLVTTPVINRPQTAIFGPNKIRPSVVMRSGKPVERLVMNFSISCDHRIIDGYDAAQMVQYIKSLLQDPMQIALNL